MKVETNVISIMSLIMQKLSRLGARMITALAAALISALLIFASPEIGIAGAVGGVVAGGIAAVLLHPHARVQ